MEELKYQIQSELSKDGTVDNMKMQLRYKLLERLQLQQKKLVETQEIKQQSLPRRLASSLVADFLKAAGLDYCLSVFVPESGYSGSLLEREEICLLLKVETEAAKSIGVLQSLCSDILNVKPREAPRQNSATQTYTGDAIMNLEQKLNQVDTSFRHKIEGELLKPQQEVEERLLRMKRDYEQRMKAELQAEVTRIREFECQSIRMEEVEKQRHRMAEYREELERNYQERLQKLRERERDIMDKATGKAKEIETLSYNYRQKVLKETEFFRMKEAELQKERELNEENIKLQKQQIESKERELNRRIQNLEEESYYILQYIKLFIIRLNYNKKYQNDIHLNRVDINNEIFEEKQQIKLKQQMIDKEINKIEQLQANIENLRKENKQLVTENEKYVDQIKDLKRKKKENEHDYTALKDAYRTLENVQRRDQELNRKWEQEISLKEEQAKIINQAMEHKENMLSDHKLLQADHTRKLTREIQQYQERIEKQETLIKELRQSLQQKEDIQPNYNPAQTYYPPQQQIIQQDPMSVNYNIQDHKHRITMLHNEMDENKQRRQEEMRRLQEDWHADKSVHQMRFKETWDLHGSSIDFSHAQKKGSEYQNLSASKINQDPMNIFKMDEASSQVMQSGLYARKPYQNIIEETYQEGYD